MSNPLPTVAVTIRITADYQAVLARTIAALKSEGFGILTEVEVEGKVNGKVSKWPQKILGGYNQALARRAQELAPAMGRPPTYHVTVTYISDRVTEVSLADPLSLLVVYDWPQLRPVAEEGRARLERVAVSLEEI